VIHARGLGKRFGTRRALVGVDLDLARGGFLVVTGPNGAGKTTLLRLCAGLLVPSEGRLDVDVDRPAIGLVGHEPLVYRELTPVENLDLYGRLYRIPERRERIGMLLERFGLWDVRRERVSAFSRGMTQRLALCRALLHEPELLLLDEPYAGLDAEGAALIDYELESVAATRTVVLATHAPARVEPLASASLTLARASETTGRRARSRKAAA
jgi:heme exporter protein A